MSDTIYGLPYEDTRLCAWCDTLHEWGELNKDKLCEKCEFKQSGKDMNTTLFRGKEYTILELEALGYHDIDLCLTDEYCDAIEELEHNYEYKPTGEIIWNGDDEFHIQTRRVLIKELA